jgi:hypothetical protein
MNYKDKKIYFAGRGELISKEELWKYIIQLGGEFIDNMEEADVIIEGAFSMHLEDRIYELSCSGTEVIDIQKLEQEFSKELDIDNILMAIKISKDQERLITLLQNRYFDDDTFIKLLKFYDWKDLGLHDSDENRNVAMHITQRFSSLTVEKHNIQHSPVGMYYVALEAVDPKLLEVLYTMPELSISDRNAHEDQPLSLKEVIALNPNSSKSLQMQIFKNSNQNELKFLALNSNLSKFVKEELNQSEDEIVVKSLIKSGNFDTDNLENYFENFKTDILKNIKLDYALFEKITALIEDEVDFVYLCLNQTLDSEMISDILEKNIQNANINLLKNQHCPKKSIEEFLQMNDKILNIAIAHNEALSQEQFELLYELNDLDIDISLASNDKTPEPILTELFNKGDFMINSALSSNEATPINILMQLLLDNRLNTNVSNNETYKAYSKQSIGILI